MPWQQRGFALGIAMARAGRRAVCVLGSPPHRAELSVTSAQIAELRDGISRLRSAAGSSCTDDAERRASTALEAAEEGLRTALANACEEVQRARHEVIQTVDTMGEVLSAEVSVGYSRSEGNAQLPAPADERCDDVRALEASMVLERLQHAVGPF